MERRSFSSSKLSIHMEETYQCDILVTLGFLKSGAGPTYIKHDDVIKWKLFPGYWPFVRGIHRRPVKSLTKASEAALLCFLRSASEQTAKQTVEMLVIWSAMVLIMTSP